MSPDVERVTHSFPQVHRTLTSLYSGWMSVFMAHPILGGHTRGQHATSKESLSSLDSSTSERESTTASRASPSPHFPPGRKTFTAAPGATPATRADPIVLPLRRKSTSNAPAAPRPRLTTTATYPSRSVL